MARKMRATPVHHRMTSLTLDRFESPFPRASDSAFLLDGTASVIFSVNVDPSLLLSVVEVYRVNDEKHIAKRATRMTLVYFTLAHFPTRLSKLAL